MIQSTPGLAEFSADSNTPEEEYHVIQLQPNEPGEEQGDNHVQDPALMMSEKDSENDSDWEENRSDDDATSECYESASDSEETTDLSPAEKTSTGYATTLAEAEPLQAIFSNRDHPAIEELVNGGRKRSVSAASYSREKRKDNRSRLRKLFSLPFFLCESL